MSIQRLSTRQEISHTLWSNAKRFLQPGWFFGINNNLQDPSEFEKAELRILVQFLSNGETRAVSATDIAIYTYIKDLYGPKVFVDLSYFPLNANTEVMDELRLPYVFGMVSHAPIKDFDVVLVSNSIIDERINAYVSFKCSDVPPFSTQREREPGQWPVVILGGSAVDNCSSMLGYSRDGKERSFVDWVFCGFVEGALEKVIDVLLEAKKAGKVRDREYLKPKLYPISFMLNPLAYDIKWKTGKDSWHVESFVKLDPNAPKRAEFTTPPREGIPNYPNFSHKILHSDGNFNAIDLQIAWGCAGKGLCSFCNEAHMVAWKEYPLATLAKCMDRTRELSLADSYSSFSLNAPYHRQFAGILREAAKRYPSVSAIAFRGDVIHTRPDYMDMLKHLGVQRQTLGVEGPSDRIRNGYLNKNLYWNELEGTLRTMYRDRIMQVKLFFIITGLEKDADWDEFFEHYDQWIKIRDEMGAKTSFKVSFTHLCIYHNVPLAWEPRRVSMMLSRKDKSLTYFMEHAKRRGLSMRFANRGRDTLYQQLVLDLGQHFTAIFQEIYDETGWYFNRGCPNYVVDMTLEIIKRRGWFLEEVLGKREYDYIWQDELILVNNKMYLMKRHKEIAEFREEPLCMPTPGKPELGGTGCAGCGLCEDKADVSAMLDREVFEDRHVTMEDVLVGYSLNKPRFRYRFVFDVSPAADHITKRPLAHYWVSRVIGKLHRDIYGFENDPWYWGHQMDSPIFAGGKYFIDLLTKAELDLAAIKGAKVPGSLLTLRNVFQLPKESSIKVGDFMLLLVDAPMNDGILSYIGSDDFNEVPVIVDGSMGMNAWGKLRDERMVRPAVKFDGGRALMVMDFPVRSNVVKYLSLASGVGYRNLTPDLHIKALTYTSKVQGKICVCSQPTHVDLLTSRVSDYCVGCLMKVALSRVTHEQVVGTPPAAMMSARVPVMA